MTQTAVIGPAEVTEEGLRAAFGTLFLAPDAVDDPYADYETLRAAGRIWQVRPGTWLMTAYEDCARVLTDERFVNDGDAVGRAKGGADWTAHPSLVMLARMMLIANPPRHRSLRTAVNGSFSRIRTEAWRADIAADADRLLDGLVDRGAVEFVTEYADRLPLLTIGRILGVPDAERAGLRGRTKDFNLLFERGVAAEDLRRADDAIGEIVAYLEDVLSFKQRNPGPDLLSALLAAAAAGSLDREEIIPLVFQVFNASYQTTMSALGNGLHLLLEHPDQAARLYRDPSLLPTAAEEIVRFDPPVQSTGRHAAVPLELGGCSVAAGDLVIVVLAAANRDPAWFERPHEFDVSRPGAAGLSFGHGIHYCLGAALAGIQIEETLAALVRRGLRPVATGPAVRSKSSNMRGLTSLPVELATTGRQ